MAHLRQKEKFCALHSGINVYIRALHLNILSNNINKKSNNLYCSPSVGYSSQSVINSLHKEKPCYQINSTGVIEISNCVMKESTSKTNYLLRFESMKEEQKTIICSSIHVNPGLSNCILYGKIQYLISNPKALQEK